MKAAGAGSGVRRALEYDPDVVFSNGVDQREITNSTNEFVITIPRKGNDATNQSNLVTDPAPSNTDPVSDQPTQNTTQLAHNTDPVPTKSEQPHIKLSRKQKDIRNFCSVPRTAKEIMNRLELSDFYNNRKRYIYNLVAAGVLERTIPDKPNDPNQKYRRKQ